MRKLFWVGSAVLLALVSMAGMASAADEPLLQFAPAAAAIDSCCILKGDANHNGIFNIADITYLLKFLYQGGPKPPCMGQADINCDCSITVRDITCAIWFFYHSGPVCSVCTCEQWFPRCFGN